MRTRMVAAVAAATMVAVFTPISTPAGAFTPVSTPAGAVTGSFDASCQLSGTPTPPPDIRTFSYEVQAPDSVTPRTQFGLPISIGYAGLPNAIGGIARFDISEQPIFGALPFVPGQSSFDGAIAVDSPAAEGGRVLVSIAEFGSFAPIVGSAITEICTPVHTTVIASVVSAGAVVSIGDASVVEGSSGTRALEFAVSLSRPATTPVTVAFDTRDGTATAGSDYVAKSGSVTFQPGLVSALATIPVRVRGDRTVEPNEHFRVRLHDPVGAVLGRAAGTGRIIDDDPGTGLRLSVGDGSVVEGARGTRSARFTVSLSAPATQRVTFHFAASDGTAVLGQDYRGASYDGFINPGSTSTTWPVPVLPNRTPEPDRTFTVRLSNVTGAAVGRSTGVGTIIDPGVLVDDG